tara:strand:- start:207 stop:1352 length:1146 start_codon:yes stop_codon:yes gene_type:complete
MSYTRFDVSNDILQQEAATLLTSTWTGNRNDMDSHHTASNQATFNTSTSSGQFHIEVYNEHTSSANSEVQYSVAYGHRLGSGSLDFTNDTGSFGLNAARVTYNQYRQLVFQDETQNFAFGTHTPDDIYVINVNRSRYKQKLNPGSLNLNLTGSSAHGKTYIQTQIHLTDDSVTNGAGATSNPGNKLGEYYNIVSGSSGVLSGSNTNQLTINGSGSTYGLFYPEAGLIILNGDAFSASLGASASAAETSGSDFQPHTVNLIPNRTKNTAAKNHLRLLHSLRGGSAAATGSFGKFVVDTAENVESKFFFIRARNAEYNYTNNPSFVDSTNNILHSSMKLNPKTFITTVGLYNDSNELLAVAKLSQPVAKDFTKEALIRVKLDY